MKLYIAHPITGLNGKDALEYFNTLKEKLSQHHQILSPMTGKEYLINQQDLKASGYKTAISNDHAIFQRDTWMVSQADIVLIDFTNAKSVSIGCCMELGIAAFLNKHTIVVMEKQNIHKHAFVLDAADIVFEELEDAYEYLIKF